MLDLFATHASDIVGIIGAMTVVTAYFLNINGTLTSDLWLYPAVNLLGSALIVFSLFYNPNPASLLIEFFWSCTSVFGLIKTSRRLIQQKRQS